MSATFVSVFETGFAPSQVNKMTAIMLVLAYHSLDFSVLDDRGGSGAWLVIVHTGAALKDLPKGCEWTERPVTHAVAL